ncbi:MAG TPA: hypothetical protein VF104_03470 [Burkholderiales bacterium]
MWLAESARGSLGHWLGIERGRIRNDQIVSPHHLELLAPRRLWHPQRLGPGSGGQPLAE